MLVFLHFSLISELTLFCSLLLSAISYMSLLLGFVSLFGALGRAYDHALGTPENVFSLSLHFS